MERLKKINQDGSVNKIIDKIRYIYEFSTADNRKDLNYLETLTVMPNVYELDLNLTSSPLVNFNLFNGLKKIKLCYNSVPNNKRLNLKIPGSVEECDIQECKFHTLIFEESDIDLKLTLKNNKIEQRLELMRLIYNSDVDNAGYQAPAVVKTYDYTLSVITAINPFGVDTNNELVMYIYNLRANHGGFHIVYSCNTIYNFSPNLLASDFNVTTVIGFPLYSNL